MREGGLRALAHRAAGRPPGRRREGGGRRVGREGQDGALVALLDPGRGRGDSRREPLDRHVDRGVEPIEPPDDGRHQRRPASGDVRVLGPQGELEIGPGVADDQVVAEPVAPLPAHVLDADDVCAVGGRIERQAGVLREAGAAVVVAVVQRHGGDPAGGEGRPGGMDLDLVDRLAHRMVLGRRLQQADPLALRVPEDAVVVGVARQVLDADQLAADQDGVVDGQVVPLGQADPRDGRIVVAERDLGLGHRPEHGAGDGLSPGVEDLDDRVDRRPESASEDLDDEPLPLPGLEAEVVRRPPRSPILAETPPGVAIDPAWEGSSFGSASTPCGPSATTTVRRPIGRWPSGRVTGTSIIAPGSRLAATGIGTLETPFRFGPSTWTEVVCPRSTPSGKTDVTRGRLPAAIR